jgi:hypothetical protein
MPVAAFLECSVQREKRGEHISSIALTFNKNDLFKCGARPAIYGLSCEASPQSTSTGSRIFTDQILPSGEQYRYIAYDPCNNIDWTHEREWRLPCDPQIIETQCQQTGICGLRLNEINNIGIIVTTSAEAYAILSDILSLVDQHLITPDKFQYILISNDINIITMKNRENEESLVEKLILRMDFYINDNNLIETKYIKEIFEIIQYVQSLSYFEENQFSTMLGESYVWIITNYHPLTRCLHRNSFITFGKNGKYLFLPPFEVSTDKIFSLEYKKFLTKKIAEILLNNYKITAGILSLRNGSEEEICEPDFSDNNTYNNLSSYNNYEFQINP